MTRYQDERRFREILDRILTPDLVAIDGGARNGTSDLPRLAHFINVHGFEPNRAEYERLLKIAKNDSLGYASTQYSPFALLDKAGTAPLYINKRTGATSTLRPNDEFLRHFEADEWSQIREVVREETVEGITLESYFEDRKISHVDWMKLDTQGNELPILQGAGVGVERISVIKIEVEMVPLYEKQPLFGDVFTFLSSRGFQFIDLQWTAPCRRFHTRSGFPLDAYGLTWGDAIFAHDPYRFDGPRKLQQALVLGELGYVDLAMYMIRNVPSISAENRAALLDVYECPRAPQSNTSFKRFLKRLLPSSFVDAVRAYNFVRETNRVARVP